MGGEFDLYTVNIFKLANNKRDDGSEESDGKHLNNQAGLVNDMNFVEKHQNMISAKVIKGRTIELEHSNLVGQAVKFKTVVNYDRTLEPGSSLGVVLVPQNGYITNN